MTNQPAEQREATEEEIDNAPIEDPDETEDHDEADLSGPEDNG